MSPGASVGASACSVQALKEAPLIGPSKTQGAVIRSCLSAAMKVVVFQCPCGAIPSTR